MKPTLYISFAFAGLISPGLAGDYPDAKQASTPPGWTLAFANNDKLPPGFRQFNVKRPDGSELVGFLAAKGDSLSHRRPLLIYLDGSGAQSQFYYKDGKRGYSVFGILANKAGDQFHVATSEKRGARF